ncbi:hypothetical protein VTL71DRAFT_9806 [Oculimacula yallundae]|uniref:Uncharacterized protein n=1 Tax=Oculimacula yallundae TaxID=86028 RepID=A0ABR4BQI1_9HELO
MANYCAAPNNIYITPGLFTTVAEYLSLCEADGGLSAFGEAMSVDVKWNDLKESQDHGINVDGGNRG